MRLEMIVEMIFNILPNQRTCPCILSRNVGAMFLDSGATFSARSNVETLLHHVFRFSIIYHLSSKNESGVFAVSDIRSYAIQ